MRAEWLLIVESQYASAEAACRGHMLNERGKKARIDPFTLFYGQEARALAYASPELREWWETNPRLPQSKYEELRTTKLDDPDPVVVTHCEHCAHCNPS